MISFVESGGVLDFKFSLANLSKQAKKYYTSTSPQLNHKFSNTSALFLYANCLLLFVVAMLSIILFCTALF